MFQLFQAARLGRQTLKTGNRKRYVASRVQSQMGLVFITELLDSGKVVPVIDRSYPLSKEVEALWYFKKEHAQGKVFITVEHSYKWRLAEKFSADKSL